MRWIGNCLGLFMHILLLVSCNNTISTKSNVPASVTVLTTSVSAPTGSPTLTPVVSTLTPESLSLPKGAVAEVSCGTGIYEIAYSPDASLLAAASWGGIFICNIQMPTYVKTIVPRSATSGGVKWSPDGTQLASGTEDGMVVIWDSITGEESIAFKVSPLAVRSVVWSPEGNKMATTFSGDLHVWDVATGNEVTNIEGFGDGSALEWSPNGQWVVYGCTCDAVLVWDVTSRMLVNDNIEGTKAPVIAIAPDGDRLAVGLVQETFRIYSLPNGETLVTPIKAESQQVLSSMAWSPNGSWLAGGGWDGSLRIWDTLTGNELAQLPAISAEPVWSLVWSPNGENLASLHGERIILWDIRQIIKDP